MRLIDADAFCKSIENIQAEYGGDNSSLIEQGDVIDLIASAPTIDAEPVRHGHWEIDETDGSYTCECGLTMWNNDLIGGNANYCPNCGAKMDEKENGNDE